METEAGFQIHVSAQPTTAEHPLCARRLARCLQHGDEGGRVLLALMTHAVQQERQMVSTQSHKFPK